MTTVFWVVTPHSLVHGYQCFRVTRCLHVQGREECGVGAVTLYKLVARKVVISSHRKRKRRGDINVGTYAQDYTVSQPRPHNLNNHCYGNLKLYEHFCVWTEEELQNTLQIISQLDTGS